MKPSLHPCEATLAALPEKLLVGVSGGVDSMALLHALIATGRSPVVAHFNHGWRADSADDAVFVKDEARKLGLKFVGGKMRANNNLPRESVARDARYAFFLKVSTRLKIRDLVQAHHADDQVETFLLQLLRGSGANGMGMAAMSSRGRVLVHRPWLGVWKKEILAYARRHNLAWREDSTNADIRHRRNLVRRRVLPYLRRQFGAHVTDNILRAAEISRAESEWLDALCAKAARAKELDARTLRMGPIAQQRRTILRWLQLHHVINISFSDVESVRDLLENMRAAKVNLSRGRHARRRAGKIFLEG